jgi:periplasmic divalent cation tolerance protein
MNPGRGVVQKPALRNSLADFWTAGSDGGRFYMTDKRVVLTTASSPDEARRIANALVERRLAACVNIVSKVDSIYRWKDKIEESQEVLLLIKTNQKEVADLRDAIKELHSYELPECIALPVDNGSEDYLQWIDDSVGSNARGRTPRK